MVEGERGESGEGEPLGAASRVMTTQSAVTAGLGYLYVYDIDRKDFLFGFHRSVILYFKLR